MFNVPCEPNKGRAIFIKEKDSEVMDGQIELQEAQHEDT